MANKATVGVTRRIRTMQQLQLEKARLRLEILRTEDKIKVNYRSILSAFALKNIFHTISELTGAPTLMSQFVTMGVNWLANRKKKKKKKREEKHENRTDEAMGAE
jgi:hypothetical protein